MKRGLKALRKWCRGNQELKRSDPRAVLSCSPGNPLFKYEEGNAPCFTTDSLWRKRDLMLEKDWIRHWLWALRVIVVMRKHHAGLISLNDKALEGKQMIRILVLQSLKQWFGPLLQFLNNHEIILLLLHNYNFTTVIGHNVNIWCVKYLISNPRGARDTRVENRCSRDWERSEWRRKVTEQWRLPLTAMTSVSACTEL